MKFTFNEKKALTEATKQIYQGASDPAAMIGLLKNTIALNKNYSYAMQIHHGKTYTYMVRELNTKYEGQGLGYSCLHWQQLGKRMNNRVKEAEDNVKQFPGAFENLGYAIKCVWPSHTYKHNSVWNMPKFVGSKEWFKNEEQSPTAPIRMNANDVYYTYMNLFAMCREMKLTMNKVENRWKQYNWWMEYRY